MRLNRFKTGVLSHRGLYLSDFCSRGFDFRFSNGRYFGLLNTLGPRQRVKSDLRHGNFFFGGEAFLFRFGQQAFPIGFGVIFADRNHRGRFFFDNRRNFVLRNQSL